MTETMREDALLHIADLHFWEAIWNPLRLLNKRVLGNANVILRRGKSFPMEKAREYADTLETLEIGNLLLTGDFTSTATAHEFALARAFVDDLASRGFRVWAIPGNHDLYTFESARRKRFEQHLGGYLPAKALPARVDLPGGTPVLFVPTVCPNLVSSRGRVTDHEIGQVAALLNACPPGPVIVAAHYPVLERTSAYAMSWERKLRNAEALREALGAARRRVLYVAGHVHRFSYVRDTRYPHVFHLTTPAFFHTRGEYHEKGAFTEIRVVNNEFEVHAHTYMGDWARQRVLAMEEHFT